MTLRGSCHCNNITLAWRNIDFSLVPRRCGCDYCCARSAEYVSKSGTAVEVVIRNPRLHATATHGSGQALFHECANCGTLVFVSATIDGELYCAINASCLDDRPKFPAAIAVDFSEQEPQSKLQRWRENWCRPLSIRG